MTFQKVAKLTEIWPGELKAVVADDTAIVLVNVDGRIAAYEDRCPHKGVPLSHGRLEGETVTCGAHHWQFDGCTGNGINPCSVALRKFNVKIEDSDILVDLAGNVEAAVPTVGPILQSGCATDAVVKAIQECNSQVTVIDRGAYVRILVPQRCTVTREAIEANLGRTFVLPGDLEMIMTAFKGQFEVSTEQATWSGNGITA